MKKVKIAESFRTCSFHVGSYSVAAAAIVVAIAVALNVLANALPSSVTKFDTSANKLYTLSAQTEGIVSALESDVTVYWVTQSGSEDGTLELLLDRYDALSDKLTVEKRDPDVYPTFLSRYNADGASNNSLIVESGSRYRYVPYSDIYVYDYSNYYYNGSYDVSFAGESELTSAIDYVISSELPKVYTLSGHGESELASDFSNAVEKENIQLDSLSLLTVESVPEDANAVLIYAPESDISQDELEKLESYLNKGGNLLLISAPPEDGALTNLESLMAGYGVTAAEGIVIEGSQSNYIWGTQYYLLPDLSSHEICTPLKDSGYYVLLPVAQGLTVSGELPEGVSVTELLTTSASAYSKVAGYALDTYDKEEGDIDGPFALAAAISAENDNGSESRIVWVSSGALLDEQTNAQVSGGNQDFFLNSLGWMCQQQETVSIHAKSLDYEYLTINSGAATTLAVTLIGIVPLAYLSIGIIIWVRRKRR